MQGGSTMSTDTHTHTQKNATLPFQTICICVCSLSLKTHTLIPKISAISIHFPIFPWLTVVFAVCSFTFNQDFIIFFIIGFLRPIIKSICALLVATVCVLSSFFLTLWWYRHNTNKFIVGYSNMLFCKMTTHSLANTIMALNKLACASHVLHTLESQCLTPRTPYRGKQYMEIFSNSVYNTSPNSEGVSHIPIGSSRWLDSKTNQFDPEKV